jgi:hypothetical protein
MDGTNIDVLLIVTKTLDDMVNLRSKLAAMDHELSRATASMQAHAIAPKVSPSPLKHRWRHKHARKVR